MLKQNRDHQSHCRLERVKPDLSSSGNFAISLAVENIHAGFTSPAEDFMEETLDINKLLVRHPASTFYVRVKGDSMMDASILEGDILVVDKAIEPYNNCIAVCFLDGEFTLKRVSIIPMNSAGTASSQSEKVNSKVENAVKKIFLMPANSHYDPIEVTSDNQFLIWGIVRYVIHKL